MITTSAWRIAAVALFASLMPVQVSADTVSAKTFSVPDGNRIVIAGRDFRLAGMIAPQPGQSCILFGKARDCGVIARSALLDLTAGAIVSCRPSGTLANEPSYRCTAGGYDLSEGMIYTGWAVPVAGAPAKYWTVLKDARSRPRGFWRGRFSTPWQPVTDILNRSEQ